jgi:hypothetical protein
VPAPYQFASLCQIGTFGGHFLAWILILTNRLKKNSPDAQTKNIPRVEMPWDFLYNSPMKYKEIRFVLISRENLISGSILDEAADWPGTRREIPSNRETRIFQGA